MATAQGVIIRVNEKEIMQILKSQVKTKGPNSYSRLLDNSYSRLLDTADTLQQIEEGNNTARTKNTISRMVRFYPNCPNADKLRAPPLPCESTFISRHNPDYLQDNYDPCRLLEPRP